MIALSDLNIIGSNIIYNSKPEDLYEITLSKKMGGLTNNRVLSVNTGKFTGRSPKDRYIVKDEINKEYFLKGTLTGFLAITIPGAICFRIL